MTLSIFSNRNYTFATITKIYLAEIRHYLQSIHKQKGNFQEYKVKVCECSFVIMSLY